LNFSQTFADPMDFIPTDIKPYLNFIHPPLMWILLATSLYAAYLGFQIRKTRSATGDEKKELIKGKFAIRHHQMGSIVLAVMVLGSIGGMAATYINNGKLFFGPHLLAGLGMTGLIAVSASLSPYMQKGADWARYSHITINLVLVGLFGWQALSGVEILQRIISKM
jgi:MFS family permease